MQSSVCTQTPGERGSVEIPTQSSRCRARCPGCGTPGRGPGNARREGLAPVGESRPQPQDGGAWL